MNYLVSFVVVFFIMFGLILYFRYLKRKSLIEGDMYIAYLAFGFIVLYYSFINQLVDILLTQLGLQDDHPFTYSMIPGLYIVLICAIYYFSESKSNDKDPNNKVDVTQNNVGRDQYNISGNYNRNDKE